MVAVNSSTEPSLVLLGSFTSTLGAQPISDRLNDFVRQLDNAAIALNARNFDEAFLQSRNLVARFQEADISESSGPLGRDLLNLSQAANLIAALSLYSKQRYFSDQPQSDLLTYVNGFLNTRSTLWASHEPHSRKLEHRAFILQRILHL